MKTKFILSAMCLPVAFAACTNEDVFVENQNTLEDAPVVDLKLSATYGAEGTASRMVNNNGTFLWEGTDVLGAVKHNGASIFSNNKFVNTLTEASASADFTTEATTVVGDYVFYYPYNTAITKSLSGITYSVPEPQVYDPTGEKMMDNNFMVSPIVKLDGNEPGELTLPLTMRSIYGFGKLNVEFPEAGMISAPGLGNVSSIKIQKIIISYNSNVEKSGKVNVATLTDGVGLPVVNLTAANLKSLREGDNNKYKGKTNEELTAILFDEADAKLVASSTEYSGGDIIDITSGTAGTETTGVSISCITEEYPMGVEVTPSQSFSTRVLLPTTADGGANVTVTIYTDKGMITYTVSGARIKANHTVNLSNPNRLVEGNDAFVLSGLDPIEDEITVISEQDFIASMAALTNHDEVEVTFSGDFELTPAAINAIPSDLMVIFKSNVKLNGDMTLKNVKFNENVTIKGGDINISNEVGFTASKTITIEAGSLNVSQEEDALKVGASALTTVVKAGAVLNIADGVVLESVINVAGGTVNFGPAASRAAAQPKGITSWFNLTNNAGVINVNVPLTIGGTATLGSSSSTNGTLTINANANIIGASYLNVEATATLNNYANVANLAANAGTINNYATISVTTNTGTIKNEADAIEGDGTLTVGTNSGKIYTVANSQTDLTTNSGYVYYAEGAFINGAGKGAHAEAGNVVFTIDADMTAEQLIKKFYNTACTSLLIKNATLTVEEDTDLSKLAAMKSITLDGANIVANDTIGFYNCPMYVYNYSKITGDAVVAFGEKDNDKLVVKNNATFETEVVIAGLSAIEIAAASGDNASGKVVARTYIYGCFNPTNDQFTTTNWVGKAYQKVLLEDLN